MLDLKKLAIICSAVAVVLFVNIALSITFDVSSIAEFQSALSSAGGNGESDTINVLPGTYYIDSTLTFWSGEDYTLTVIGAGTDSTILDGGDSMQAMEMITASSGGNIRLANLTIRNCQSDYGGGVYLETTSALITVDHCDFIDNNATMVGGGLNAYSNIGGFEVSYCNFIGNSSVRAGGLFLQSDAGTFMSLTHSNFEGNSANVDGGANMLYPLGAGVTLIVEDNTFTDNESGEFGGGCWVRLPAGNSIVNYHNNEFVGNSSTTAGDAGGSYIEIQSGYLDYSGNSYMQNSTIWNGGGAWIYCVSGTLSIRDNFYVQNTAEVNGGGISVGIDEGLLQFEHNILDSNYADNVGGGASVASIEAGVEIFHNTFYNNFGSEGRGLYAYFEYPAGSSEIYNNIFWLHGTAPLGGSGAVPIVARYSDIMGGEGQPWFGEGCIDANPLFADPGSRDFQITWDSYPADDELKSPCIDTGDPASENDPDDTRADMGALYYDQGTAIVDNSILPHNISLRAYPNPFNSSVTIAINAPVGAYCNTPLRIEIYDVAGMMVDVISQPLTELVEVSGGFAVSGATNAKLPSAQTGCKQGSESDFATLKRGGQALEPVRGGAYIWHPAPSLGSGVYLIQATVGKKTASKRIILLK